MINRVALLSLKMGSLYFLIAKVAKIMLPNFCLFCQNPFATSILNKLPFLAFCYLRKLANYNCAGRLRINQSCSHSKSQAKRNQPYDYVRNKYLRVFTL